MKNISQAVADVNELILDVKELIDGMHRRPLMYVSEVRLDYMYHFISGYLGRVLANGKEDFRIPFKRLMFDWISEWIEENIDKNYEPKDFCWYRMIYELTNSESEAVELFFKICDEILYEVSESEEDLKRCRISR